MIKFFSGIILFMIILSCSRKESSENLNSGSLEQDTFRHEYSDADTSQEISEYLSNANFDQLLQNYEDPQRVEWQNPDLVLEKLGNLNGQVVADIGAGSGYFTFRMAQSARKVIAIDVDPRFLEYIEERKEEIPQDLSKRIETRHTKEDDPGLERSEVDIALVVNTYHFLDSRSEYFKKVKRGLSGKGFLVIVDFKNMSLPVGPPRELLVSPEAAINELREAGFQEFSLDEKSLEYQYILKAS